VIKQDLRSFCRTDKEYCPQATMNQWEMNVLKLPGPTPLYLFEMETNIFSSYVSFHNGYCMSRCDSV
jgi:hypothetical protein